VLRSERVLLILLAVGAFIAHAIQAEYPGALNVNPIQFIDQHGPSLNTACRDAAASGIETHRSHISKPHEGMADIFSQPISRAPPLAVFPRNGSHPVSRDSVLGDPRCPVGTNK